MSRESKDTWIVTDIGPRWTSGVVDRTYGRDSTPLYLRTR